MYTLCEKGNRRPGPCFFALRENVRNHAEKKGQQSQPPPIPQTGSKNFVTIEFIYKEEKNTFS